VINVGILTLSDKGSKGERVDESGETIRRLLADLAPEIKRYEVIPDDLDLISAKLTEWSDGGGLDLILTTGGTGLSPRDVTPEATLGVVDRLAPGFAEVMRAESLKVTPMGMLSRAVAGVRGKTLIINLPGSPKAVKECLEVIKPALPHAVEVVRGEAAECATGNS
jgi:molybdenum cofactor synthesis domain-containing protein